MTRDEFLSLPPNVALQVLIDASPKMLELIAPIEKPRVPTSPKFDQIIYRSGGITWASEYDAEGLAWWRDTKAENALKGGDYAEKNLKASKSLGYWLEWRRAHPNAIWSGERNRQPVTAAAPRAKPTVYPKEPRNDAPAAAASGALPSLDDDPDIDF